jgi:CHAT domain-containing protein/tetratricopeptide (TPR) repeat protein
MDRQPSKDASLNWKAFFSSPAPRFALMILVILALGFGVWRIFIYQSDSEKGLAQLRLAYRGQRPVEPRITVKLDYAPAQNTRGETPSTFDETALARAEKLLSYPVDASSHHALGLLCLMKRQFAEALDEFNIALESDADNAGLYNDLGALYLEKAKQARIEKKADESLNDLALGLKHISSALEINNALSEALFNKALVLQEMKLTLQAQQAWQKYLEKDAVTSWADEARQDLELLRSGETQTKTPDEILQDFLAAYQAKDDEKAYRIVSRNREMITGKLVPQRLIYLFLSSADENRENYLPALRYLGRLEKERANDPFYYEIADYYSRVPKGKLPLLKNAYDAIQKGYDLSQAEKNKEALETFSLARDLFEQAGNFQEAALTEYWIAYCEYGLDQISESDSRLSRLADLCHKKSYKWLSAQVFYRFCVNGYGLKEISKSLNYGKLSLEFSEETFDFYNIQKTYSLLSDFLISVKQYPEALKNMAAILTVIDAPEYSRRQKWRDLDRAARLFHNMKLYDAAASFEKEAFDLNRDQIKNVAFERIALANLSRIYGAKNKFEDAISFAQQSREAAEKLPDEQGRQKGIGFALLQTAELELKRGNFQESLSNYEKAIELYSSMQYKPYEYEAEKGRLLCYLANKNDEAIKNAIPDILKLFESGRGKILEEQSRDTFFDDAQNIYDLAVGYEYGKGNYEKAFDYAENSRSRSLLDWQKNRGNIVFEKGVPQIVFDENTVSSPLSLAEIRPRLPEQAQLVYYSVLPDKVLIWLVTRDKFETFSYDISDHDLADKVTSFIEAIKSQNNERQEELSRALYQILLSRIEDHLDPAREIFFIPEKILCHLPFAALISGKTGNYIVADYEFSYAPSANVFVASSENASKRSLGDAGQETLLSIGDPAFDGQEFPRLQPLSAAGQEAKGIAEFYPERPVLLLGPNATKAKIKEKIAEADVVQFAGHYVTNGSSFLLSSFAVAGVKEDSRWANYEVLQETLERPRLIVLSACETGVEGYSNGEGMIGAGRTFLALGVPLVVATQWEVNSDATTVLMKKFHRSRKKENLSTVSALRQAQLEMLNNTNNPLYRRPYYWAGFIALGGYAQF